MTAGWHSSYTGASAVDLDDPMGFAFRRTQAESAGISVSFFGTAVYLCINANKSQYNLTVDGRTYTTTMAGDDPACTNYGAEAVLVASGLDPAQHTATLSVSATQQTEFHFFGATTTLGVNTNGNAAGDDIVANQATNWHFLTDRASDVVPTDSSGAQLQPNDSLPIDCVKRSDSQSVASILFTGAGAILLKGDVFNASQLFSVDLDGRTATMNASSSWPETGVVLFAQGNLDPSSHHRLTVRNYTSGPSYCSLPGKLKLFLLKPGNQVRVEDSSTVPEMHDMFMTAAIGGAFGGFAAMVILFIGVVCYIRRLRCRDRRAKLHAPSPLYLPVPLLTPGGNDPVSKPFLVTGFEFDTKLQAGIARIAKEEPSSAISTSGSRDISAVDAIGASGRRGEVLALFVQRMASWRRSIPRVETSDSLPSYRA